MIRHFVFFSAQEGQLEVVLEGLKILEKIPHADLVEVRLNEKLDQLSNEIDVVVYAEFPRMMRSQHSKRIPCIKNQLNACDPIVNYDLSPTRAPRSHYSTVIHTGQWSDGFSIARSV